MKYYILLSNKHLDYDSVQITAYLNRDGVASYLEPHPEALSFNSYIEARDWIADNASEYRECEDGSYVSVFTGNKGARIKATLVITGEWAYER